MSGTNPFVFANLVTQVEELTQAVQVLLVAGTVPAPANDNARPAVKLRPFKAAPVALKKAAHNAGRQAQKRLGAKHPEYTRLYCSIFDGHMNRAGFRGKYQERNARRAAAAAQKAA